MSPATRSLLRAAWLEFCLPWRSFFPALAWSATAGAILLFLVFSNLLRSWVPSIGLQDRCAAASESMAWSVGMMCLMILSASLGMTAGRPRSGPAALIARSPWLMLFACTLLFPAAYLHWSAVTGLIGIYMLLSGVPLLILIRHRDIVQMPRSIWIASIWALAAWAGLQWMLGAPAVLSAINHRVGMLGGAVGGILWFAALRQIWRGRGHAMAAQVGTGLGESKQAASGMTMQLRGFPTLPPSAWARAYWLARIWHRGGLLGVGCTVILFTLGITGISACVVLLLTGELQAPRQFWPTMVVIYASLYPGILTIALAFHLASSHRHLLYLPIGTRRELAAVQANALTLAGLGLAVVWAVTAGVLLIASGAVPWPVLLPVASCLLAVILWLTWLATWGWWGKILSIPLVLSGLISVVSFGRALATGHAGLVAAALVTAGLIAAIAVGHVALRRRLATWQPDT